MYTTYNLHTSDMCIYKGRFHNSKFILVRGITCWRCDAGHLCYFHIQKID